ncbi:MAG TPA: dihydrodipicolinate synthase family protein [Gemmatimonadales bacterium]
MIPAHPLALTAQRKLDERRQAALTRYYLDAGAGGVAVGVHTTQFAIRAAGLYRPVLELAADTILQHAPRGASIIKVAGIVGKTRQAVREATVAAELGYHAGLLSLGALQRENTRQLIAHAREVARVVPLFGFYLQPAVGGRVLDCDFWRRFCEIENVVAIKVAPFNRYQTMDVMRAVAESGRQDIALYTGNDDHIILDLLTEYRFDVRSVHFVGGLLGQWAVWTKRAVEHLEMCHQARHSGRTPKRLLDIAQQLTEANAAIFDVRHSFAGCIAGIHEVLRSQGLLAGTWCLDRKETLAPGQREAIARVRRATPQLNDDAFVARHKARWLR